MKKTPISRKTIQLLPSLCTTGSMLCGFFSIIRSIHGDHVQAAWAIFFAGFFDLIDGRVARMTNSQSDFGKEYDSLVDLASFGMAPAVMIYTWGLSQFRPWGFFFSFVYFACVALRLARFNVQSMSVEKKRFQGLPCPPAAGVLASSILLFSTLSNQGQNIPHKEKFILLMAPSLAVLMVSNVGYRSFKEYNVQKSNAFYFLVGAVIFFGSIIIKPEVVIPACFLFYALSGPVRALFDMLNRERKKTVTRYKSRRQNKLSVVEIQHKRPTLSEVDKKQGNQS